MGIRKRKYEKLKLDPLPWYCPISPSEFPFFQMKNKELKNFLKISKTLIPKTKLLIKSFKQLKEMLKEFENPVSFDFYDAHVSTRSRFINLNINYPSDNINLIIV